MIAGYRHRTVTLLYSGLTLIGVALGMAWFAGVPGSGVSMLVLAPSLSVALVWFVNSRENQGRQVSTLLGPPPRPCCHRSRVYVQKGPTIGGWLYHQRSGQRSLRAMVDSGADATLIPLSVLEAVGATYKETMWMRGITGERVEVDRYLVAIRIGANVIRGVHVVAAPPSSDAIIGRDVLNQLIVTLDGPGEVTAVRN